MAEDGRRTVAVHFFYLLKEDTESLQRLWALLGAGSGSPRGTTSEGLASSSLEPEGHCQVVHKVELDELDLCLLMLADMSAIEIVYHRPASAPLGSSWRQVLEKIDETRALVDREKAPLLGETTVLVAGGAREADIGELAAAVLGADELVREADHTEAYTTTLGRRVPAGTILASELEPGISSGGFLLNFILPGQDSRVTSRDYYALATGQPEAVIACLLPEVDAALKKLARVTAHFEQERLTIASERSVVDRQVGAVLHQQLITETGTPGTGRLEEQIASLSRMFGVLGTDSLLVRRAEDQLHRSLKTLDDSLDQLIAKGPGARDEISKHYHSIYAVELEAVRDNLADLAFSRQSAQAAIEVVRTQVELLRAGEEAAIQSQTKELLSRSLLLQQERLALQVAAGFVEFVLVFYYVLKSWEGIVGQNAVEHIQPVLRLIVVAAMSAGAALGTHFLARALHRDYWKGRGLWLSVALLAVSLGAMVLLSIGIT